MNQLKLNKRFYNLSSRLEDSTCLHIHYQLCSDIRSSIFRTLFRDTYEVIQPNIFHVDYV
jgi:hypothetical protein